MHDDSHTKFSILYRDFAGQIDTGLNLYQKLTYLITKIQPKKYISLLSSLYLTASPQARTCVFTVRSRRDV